MRICAVPDHHKTAVYVFRLRHLLFAIPRHTVLYRTACVLRSLLRPRPRCLHVIHVEMSHFSAARKYATVDAETVLK